MTPTSVGLVLVEGHEATGATMDRAAFDVDDGPEFTPERATAAVLRTEAMAATRGVRLHAIGVTWSEDADDQASAVLRSLSESGFDNVVPIRMPEATEALARGCADVLGYATTAVCVIEPDAIVTLIVHTDQESIQTASNHAIQTEQDLIGWLSDVFTRADWQPDALVLVGSGGVDELLPHLEDALSVPVYSPAEAELALARGAALASTTSQPVESPFRATPAPPRSTGTHRTEAQAGPSAQRAALTLLIVGLVTFVVSVSVAISLALTPDRPALSERAAPTPLTPPVSPPAASSVAPPPAPPVPPAADPEPQPPAALQEAVDQAPAAPQEAVEAALPEVPQDTAVGVPEASLPGSEVAPPAALPPVPAAPEEKKPLRSRIMDRLRGVGEPDPAAPPAIAPPPAPAVPPVP